jgi:opacity protein-like surface antigen
MPLGRQFEVFLRAGVLFADRKLQMAQFDQVDETFGSTVWLGGVGVNWALASRWAVRAEYQQTGKFDETLLAGESELRRMALSVLFEL